MSKLWPDLLPHLLGHPPAPKAGEDGFGQGLIDDMYFLARSRRLRSREIAWREATRAEADAIAADAFLGRFAERVTALAWADGRACVVLERDWHGFPDPPQYALFAMRDRKVEIAGDFDDWPRGWRIDAPRTSARPS